VCLQVSHPHWVPDPVGMVSTAMRDGSTCHGTGVKFAFRLNTGLNGTAFSSVPVNSERGSNPTTRSADSRIWGCGRPSSIERYR